MLRESPSVLAIHGAAVARGSVGGGGAVSGVGVHAGCCHSQPACKPRRRRLAPQRLRGRLRVPLRPRTPTDRIQHGQQHGNPRPLPPLLLLGHTPGHAQPAHAPRGVFSQRRCCGVLGGSHSAFPAHREPAPCLRVGGGRGGADRAAHGCAAGAERGVAHSACRRGVGSDCASAVLGFAGDGGDGHAPAARPGCCLGGCRGCGGGGRAGRGRVDHYLGVVAGGVRCQLSRRASRRARCSACAHRLSP
mmetsp:Transcript_60482/g.124458  ORF Transcript_60482/g.124458 Transcript_60482/m.124458 type:complete len:247 (-) Transcript_60482:1273-2013(-)